MTYIGKLSVEPILQQRAFTALDGSAQVYNYRTIRMNCGIDHFTGEMTGELAVKWPHQQQLDNVALWAADVTLHTKEFQTMNGEQRTVTVVRVTRLEPLA